MKRWFGQWEELEQNRAELSERCSVVVVVVKRLRTCWQKHNETHTRTEQREALLSVGFRRGFRDGTTKPKDRGGSSFFFPLFFLLCAHTPRNERPPSIGNRSFFNVRVRSVSYRLPRDRFNRRKWP